jgi:ribosomal-protein-alanine N-acetyltransferase
MELIIRNVRDSDIEGIVHLWKKNIVTNTTPFEIKQLFQSYGKYFYLAEDNNGTVGFVAGTPKHGLGRILGIAVEEEYKGKSIGGKLLNIVENTFIKEDINEIYLEVRVSNHKAMQFYKKQGYKHIKIKKEYYSNGEDAALYGKEL